MRAGRLTAAIVGTALAMTVAASTGSAEVNDTIGVVKRGEDDLSNVEVAARLAEATFADDVDTVLIGRDDVFADSMASGVLQGGSPLLLVPRDGPLPRRVRDELALLDPQRVIILGGVEAISQDMEDQLAVSYRVERRAGPTRFETAIEVARTDAPAADTAILARAFSGEGGDDSQAFADALAAGGWAAASGWPVLLTQSETLTGSTREYLAASDIERVMVIGGTAAISDAVTDELSSLVGEFERIGGATRFATAIEIAEKRGASSAADAARVVLVQGEGSDAWAAGFAAASHSAEFSAPIVLARGDQLPDVTERWLSGPAGGSAFSQATPGTVTRTPANFPVLTCVTVPSVCEQARVALGLPAQVELQFGLPPGSQVPGTGPITINLGSGAQGAVVRVSGDCVVPATLTPTNGAVQVPIAAGAPAGDCVITLTLEFPNGTIQTETITYVIPAPSQPPRQPDSEGAQAPPPAPVGDRTELRISKSGPPGAFPGQQFPFTIVVTNSGAVTANNVTVVDTLPTEGSFVSSSPAATPSGGTVTFSLGDLAAGASRTITITYQAPDQDTTLVNTAAASSANAATVSATATVGVGTQTVASGGAVAAAGVGLRNRESGDLVVTGLPADAVVTRAVLVWAYIFQSGNVPGDTVTFNDNTVTANLTQTVSGNLCWGDDATIGYAADVTSLVAGNGTYVVSGLDVAGARVDADPSPVGFPNAEGASLIVFYEAAGVDNQILSDFAYTAVPGGVITRAFSGFSATGNTARLVLAGPDGQNSSENTTVTGSGSANFPDTFDGSDPISGSSFAIGNLWDTDLFDVSQVLPSGQTTLDVRIDAFGDCIGVSAAILSISAVGPPPE